MKCQADLAASASRDLCPYYLLTTSFARTKNITSPGATLHRTRLHGWLGDIEALCVASASFYLDLREVTLVPFIFLRFLRIASDNQESISGGPVLRLGGSCPGPDARDYQGVFAGRKSLEGLPTFGPCRHWGSGPPTVLLSSFRQARTFTALDCSVPGQILSSRSGGRRHFSKSWTSRT